MSMEKQVKVSKPLSFWKKPVQIQFKGLFVSLSKAIVDGMFQNWENVSIDAVDVLTSVGLETTPGERAWELIYKAIVQSVYEIIGDNKELFIGKTIDNEFLNLEIDKFVNKDLIIDSNFFKAPKELSAIKETKKMLYKWLIGCNILVAEAEAEAICNRLSSYFIYELNNEWRINHEKYASLIEEVITPFSKSADVEREWECYFSWLEKQLDEPLFLEAFSLKQIYIPLNAYYVKKVDDSTIQELTSGIGIKNRQGRIVVDLEAELGTWINKGDKNDALRIVCGGPGCGKSSFAKVFATYHAVKGKYKVLFIPLHHFELKSDLIDAINTFVSYEGIIKHIPLDIEGNEERLLIIFDGLDELAFQGKLGVEVAQQFIREVQQKLYNFNQRNLRLQVIITGRELVIQSNESALRKEKQILNILPYFVPETDREKFPRQPYRYIDLEGLLKEDKRQVWWKVYGKIKGKSYNKLPKELEKEKLVEITSQPLLNYLVALSYEREKIDFTKEDNLNKIYEDLIKSVYDRDCENGVHRSLYDMEYDQFIRILEEIALSTWHGDGRTTTVKDIEIYCENSSLKHSLEVFQNGASQGVTRLLTAFYFRQSYQQIGGDKTFEFTHKSFGEYLTARRIVRGIQIIDRNVQQKKENTDMGWAEKESLKYWIQLCGPTIMDEYIYNFVFDELRQYDVNTIKKWHESLTVMMNYSIKNGMPFELLSIRPVFINELKQSRNSEETLFVLLSLTAEIAETKTLISWPTNTSFGELLARLQGQRKTPKNILAIMGIKYLNFDKAILHISDLYKGDFLHLDLKGAELDLSILNISTIIHCNLDEGKFNSALMNHCVINDVTAKRARFYETSFHSTEFNNVDFEGSYFRGTDFSKAKLVDVSFDNASLDSVNFKEADLDNVSFNNTKINRKDLNGIKIDGKKATSQKIDALLKNSKKLETEGLDETAASLEV